MKIHKIRGMTHLELREYVRTSEYYHISAGLVFVAGFVAGALII